MGMVGLYICSYYAEDENEEWAAGLFAAYVIFYRASFFNGQDGNQQVINCTHILYIYVGGLITPSKCHYGVEVIMISLFKQSQLTKFFNFFLFRRMSNYIFHLET